MDSRSRRKLGGFSLSQYNVTSKVKVLLTFTAASQQRAVGVWLFFLFHVASNKAVGFLTEKVLAFSIDFLNA